MSRPGGTTSNRDPLAEWPVFAQRVRDRLEKGRHEYHDQSFSKHPMELLGEIQAELLDVCGWSFVLWHRVESLREALKVAELEEPSV